MLRQNDDILLQVKTVADIHKAKEMGKTGIILGFQNVSAFEDRLGYIQLFKELGVGIAQMAYNTYNLVGAGCYESKDGGLTDFGYEVVAEMNRVGIMCDLSHVGPQTSEDVIKFSKKPVCYSHCLPAGLKEHPRDKSDEQLKFIADHGGFIGVTMFSPFLEKGTDATDDDYVAAIDYVINIVGEDRVGIGTDFTQDYGQDFFDWITHDKGTARKLIWSGFRSFSVINFLIPLITASAGFFGVEETLATSILPVVSSTKHRSVKVPPVSIPNLKPEPTAVPYDRIV
jgi:membrane dipeptidase